MSMLNSAIYNIKEINYNFTLLYNNRIEEKADRVSEQGLNIQTDTL